MGQVEGYMPEREPAYGLTEEEYQRVFRIAKEAGAKALSVKRDLSATVITFHWDEPPKDEHSQTFSFHDLLQFFSTAH
jgi:hypothetical protein